MGAGKRGENSLIHGDTWKGSSTHYWNYLDQEDYSYWRPCTGGLSAVNANGTQLQRVTSDKLGTDPTMAGGTTVVL